MDAEIQINNSASPSAKFVGWAPSPCRIRITNPAGAQGKAQHDIRLTSISAASAGAVVFRAGTTGSFASPLTVRVPINGNWLSFFIPARFGRPRLDLNDLTRASRRRDTL